MSLGNLYLTCDRIRLQGRAGALRPDSDGYYEMPIGGFNCENSIGEVYTLENIDKIFADSSELKRKIASGKMMGEWGHPVKKPGESDVSYMNRAGMVDDKETCVFFKDVWLDDKVASSDLMKGSGISPQTVVTMAHLKPHGSKWECLQRALDDPNMNMSFSVRNLSYDRTVRGVVYVIIATIITWDAVIDPGIKAASKWLAPKLESTRIRVTPQLLNQMEKELAVDGVRQEAAEQSSKIIQLGRDFFNFKQTKRSAYVEW